MTTILDCLEAQQKCRTEQSSCLFFMLAQITKGPALGIVPQADQAGTSHGLEPWRLWVNATSRVGVWLTD